MTEPKSKEWSLVIFTVGLQLAAGLAIVNAVVPWVSSVSTQAARTSTALIFPIVLAAMLMSIFHIGRPLAIWRALANVGDSRLTHEIVICIVFAVLAFLECTLWWMNLAGSPLLHLATAFAGAAAVLSSARIYTIPSQPLWNSGWLPSSFAGSTLLLGGVAANVMVGDQAKIRLTDLMVGIGAAVLLASTAVMVRVITRVSRARYAAPEAAAIMQTKHWLMVCGQVVLGCLIPLILIRVQVKAGPAFATGVLILTLAGVTFGRTLMYSRGTELSRF